MSKKKLGRGLDAILGVPDSGEKGQPAQNQPIYEKIATSQALAPSAGHTPNAVQKLDPHLLKPNPNQPRTVFSETALAELAASIKEHGIIQPVIVTEEAGEYFILAGERRTRAAIMAGLTEIPVIIADIDPSQNLELALIENIQRENLNPLEEARAYKKLLGMYDLTQDELAKKLGKSRPAVANALRLLQLPDYALDAISAGTLSSGHARAVLSVSLASEQKKLFHAIIEESLTVREAEAMAAKLNAGERHNKMEPKKTNPKASTALPPELASIQQKFLECLGTKVLIKGTETSGTVEISYFSKDDLTALYERITRE